MTQGPVGQRAEHRQQLLTGSGEMILVTRGTRLVLAPFDDADPGEVLEPGGQNVCWDSLAGCFQLLVTVSSKQTDVPHYQQAPLVAKKI